MNLMLPAPWNAIASTMVGLSLAGCGIGAAVYRCVLWIRIPGSLYSLFAGAFVALVIGAGALVDGTGGGA
jgi:hypothetical protein